LNISVTEVKVGSTVVPYTMGANAVNYDYLNGGLDSVRITLCDPTTSGAGYLDKATAVAQTLSISFSVTGLNDDAAATTTAATTTAVSETATTVATTVPVTQQAPSTVTTTAVATPTQTADLSVGAIAVGAVAAISLAGAAFTVTRRKKK